MGDAQGWTPHAGATAPGRIDGGTVRRNRSRGFAGGLRRGVLGASGLCLSIVLVACSSAPTSGPGSSPAPTPTGTVRTLAVLAPLTGEDAESGRGVLQSVQTAVLQRMQELDAAQIRLGVLALDDRGQPSVGQQQATKLPDDTTVVAVIGSVGSLVNEGVQPILNNAGLAMVAPGGGAPWLTRRGVPPERAYDTFFRLCAVDADRGTAAAQRALAQGDRRAVVVDDGTSAYAATGRAFSTAFTAGGGAVVRVVVEPDASVGEISAAVTKVKRANPQTLFMSTDADQVPLISTALAVRSLRPRLVTALPPEAPDIAAAQRSEWTGVTTATVGASPATLPGRPDVAPATPPPEGEVPPGPYGAAAYDAANLVVDALLGVLEDRPSDDLAIEALRREIVRSIAAASISGATGRVSFNRFGDVVNRPVGFLTFDGMEWIPQPAVVVGPGA